MFISWKDNNTANPVVKDVNAKKVSRLKMDSNGEWIYHFHQTYIDGIIESGDYGTQEDIIDIETGTSKYTKTGTDASLVPFYFMLYIITLIVLLNLIFFHLPLLMQLLLQAF